MSFPELEDIIKLCDLKTYTQLNGILCKCVKVFNSESNCKPFIMVKLDFEFNGKYIHKIHPKNYKVISSSRYSKFQNNKVYEEFLKNVPEIGINS